MVDVHLRRRADSAPPVASGEHLDDDLLSVFTEGRLSDSESAPILKHLVACSFCRHITAQLVRLESTVEEPAEALPTTQEDPGRIRRLLDDLASRALVSSDDEAVFAYHSPAEDLKSKSVSGEKQDGSLENTDDVDEK